MVDCRGEMRPKGHLLDPARFQDNPESSIDISIAKDDFGGNYCLCRDRLISLTQVATHRESCPRQLGPNGFFRDANQFCGFCRREVQNVTEEKNDPKLSR